VAGASLSREEGTAKPVQQPRTGQLAGYHLLTAVRADLLRRLDRPAEAAQAYLAAIDQAGTEPERHYLKRRLAEITGSPDEHATSREPASPQSAATGARSRDGQRVNPHGRR
jgi:RNA polymerase sigma-70 factor, ECF subfamily